MLTRTFFAVLLWDVVRELLFVFCRRILLLRSRFFLLTSFQRPSNDSSEQHSVSAVFGPRQCLEYPDNRSTSCLCDLVHHNAGVRDRIRSHLNCPPSCSFLPQPSGSDKPADIPGRPPTSRPTPAASAFHGHLVGALLVIHAIFARVKLS